MEDQVVAMQAKVAKWVDGIRTKRINATNAWHCLNSTIMKTLECPLMATTLTEEESGAIMWPLLQAASGSEALPPQGHVWHQEVPRH